MPLPRPAPGQLKWWIMGTIGIGAGIAMSVWFGLSMTAGAVTWQTFGYKVVDDQRVTVTFDVTRQDGRPVTCSVYALARDFSTVGSTETTVPQSDSDTTRQTVTIRTTTRAVTGAVKTCTMR